MPALGVAAAAVVLLTLLLATAPAPELLQGAAPLGQGRPRGLG
jgi:hypothetical protein